MDLLETLAIGPLPMLCTLVPSYFGIRFSDKERLVYFIPKWLSTTNKFDVSLFYPDQLAVYAPSITSIWFFS